ncbi:MAG: pentapeptide repeat-containing protein, partial [Pseudomonadota bacterium]
MTDKTAEEQEKRDAVVKAAFEAYEKGRIIPGEDGKPRKQKPLADITPLWEAMWIAADFSWAGLADAGWERGDKANRAQELKRWRAPTNFPWGGAVHGEGETAWKKATLQDYWRWSLGLGDHAGKGRLLSDADLIDRGLLKEVDGKLFHLIHCADSQLAAPDTLWTLIQERLLRASALVEDGADNRAQFSGSRARSLDAAWRAFAEDGNAKRFLFIMAALSGLEGINASGLTFGDRADFSRATLGDRASFFRTTLGDRADFTSATLGDRASFFRATLGERASFSGATLGDRADFTSATLGDGASFFSTTLGDRARFFGATLGDGADFVSATLGDQASFSGATLGDGARF